MFELIFENFGIEKFFLTDKYEEAFDDQSLKEGKSE